MSPDTLAMAPQRRLFGTDGIRGTANTDPMTAETALRLGQAAGLLFTRGAHRHRVVIGKDTRLSGYMIEPALVAGFIGAGMDVRLVGPLPTPAIAMLTRSLRADLGVMISASHNPFEDNGIKLFGPDGFKLSDETEAEIEALMGADLSERLAAPRELGRAARLDDAAGRYIEAAKSAFPRGLRLDGLKIVVDCANGAAYRVAPTVLWELGAEVISVGVSPDGFNINRDCGSTVPSFLCGEVRRHGADLGLALDGDADRLIVCDEHGQIVDGDQILALIARSWARCRAAARRRRGCDGDVQPRAGAVSWRARAGAAPHPRRRPLCDGKNARGRLQPRRRAVRPRDPVRLRHHRRRAGGGAAGAGGAGGARRARERGDAGCSIRCRSGCKSVRFSGASPLQAPSVKAAIAEAEAALDGTGRLLIRASGTEPLIRVMAEGEDADLVDRLVDGLCERIAEVAEREADTV